MTDASSQGSTTNQSTYIRKIGAGQYEYGFVSYPKNFRKRSDVYTPVGVCDSVTTANVCASLLAHGDQP